MSTFHKELETLINKYSIENDSNTPDFILASYLHDCLGAFNNAMIHRDKWYGIEQETQAETVKIMKKYQEQMNKDLEEVRARIVAQAGVRLSSHMSMQDLGSAIRIEITKDTTTH